MKLPRDQVVHANLQTSFVLFDGLLADLAEREIDGYVQLKAAERAAVVYLSGGAVCGASFRDGQGEHAGEDALGRVRAAAKERGGTIWVFEAPAALIRLAASKGQREAVYRDLSTEFVDLERLMETLARDGHTGYVEVALRNAPSTACLFMDDGEMVDAVLADESHAESGLNLVPTILKAVAASGATLHVWKAAGLAAREPKPRGTGASRVRRYRT
ncbi:MAG: hypothetical protein U5Q44_07175 [Dehalococcoidia bacterium]|nr:hypothetical protein [Dehalococcoidia bacterium]